VTEVGEGATIGHLCVVHGAVIGAEALVGNGASRQVDMCLDAGVNLIDTADVYSGGLAEEILGQVLRGRRDQVLVATKVRMPMGRGPNDAGLSRHHVISGCEASLRRLGTDHIVSQQIYYSLQAREAEYELIPLAVDQGLGVLVWSPLAGGLLSGKYRRGHEAPAGSRQLTDWGEPPVYDPERLYDTVEVLVKIAEQHGVSAAQLALAYTLAKPAVTSLVIGARTQKQLADNLAAASLVLGDDERAQLDKVSAPPLIYPYWHQAKTARDRLSAADLTLLAPYLD